MRLQYFGFFLILAACTQRQTSPHIADLPKFQGSTQEIQLLLEDDPIGSSDPLHNVVPAHGSTLKGKIHWKIWPASCLEADAIKICAENFLLNAGLKVTGFQNAKEVDSFRINPGITDILFRFIGAPSADMHTLIQFENQRVGLQHTPSHFTVFRNGRFCKSLQTNPNHSLTFGIHTPTSQILLFSSGTGTEIDRPVDGWRVYDEALLCN